MPLYLLQSLQLSVFPVLGGAKKPIGVFLWRVFDIAPMILDSAIVPLRTTGLIAWIATAIQKKIRRTIFDV